ncbi:hypothetical protein [Gloeobacter kilaueensis]|uniref:Uncharacterized protein n=1 Tax=Gloeobacter kilaueensis (strain ATCC BAA-2537 / CCAP 1431/1 / ULC 316 / JS1) TaxID=1183438 RepID=U5QHN9_GLOK1|nr:hypothetical protein [Gloeobacter kilaueensis]AGY58487.1 hypothetical protein GKIL_2241 [Gloeobacter kilaueensis JS1]
MNGLDKFTKKYRLVCTLTYGDIYGQVVIWLGVIFVSLAVALATMNNQPLLSVMLLGLILVVSLPFLLFSFVTTLFNHIEVMQTNLGDDRPLQTKSYTRTND